MHINLHDPALLIGIALIVLGFGNKKVIIGTGIVLAVVAVLGLF